MLEQRPIPKPLRRRSDPLAPPAAVDLEVVVARHAEPVDWTRNLPASVRVSLYDKGGDLAAARFPWARVVRLPNVGREAHTYIEHILARWVELAPLTLFCQGHPFDHAFDLHHVARALVAGHEAVEGFRWLGHILDTDDARGRRLFVNWSKNQDRRELAVDLFHETLFGAPAPARFHFRPGGQFVVCEDTIRARPREFWQRALELAVSFPDSGHCFERLWDRIFGFEAVDPAELGPGGCRYLKPIRRLESGVAVRAPPSSRRAGERAHSRIFELLSPWSILGVSQRVPTRRASSDMILRWRGGLPWRESALSIGATALHEGCSCAWCWCWRWRSPRAAPSTWARTPRRMGPGPLPPPEELPPDR